MTPPPGPRTAAGQALLAPPCDCGIIQVYGALPWGVSHAAKCAANGGLPLESILAIEAEAAARPESDEERARRTLDEEFRKPDRFTVRGNADDLMEAAPPDALRAALERLLDEAFTGIAFLTHNGIPMQAPKRVERAIKQARAALAPAQGGDAARCDFDCDACRAVPE